MSGDDSPKPFGLGARVARLLLGFSPLLASVFALSWCVAFTREYGIDAPCSDGWPYVALHEKFAAGTLGFRDLFAMHNEHLYFFPRLMFVLLGAASHLDLTVQTMATDVELLLALAVVYLAAARQFRFAPLRAEWWFLPIPFLIFTPAQARNLTCSFQSGFVLSMPFSLVAFYGLKRFTEASGSGDPRWARVSWFVLALVAATVSSFSTAMGLGTWVAGVVVLVLVSGGIDKRALAVWLATGLAEWTTYFVHFRGAMGSNHVERVATVAGSSISGVVEFAVAFFGIPVAAISAESLIAGVIALALLGASLVLLFRAGKWNENSFFVACSAWVLVTSAMIAVGRIHLGPDYALQSRYVSYCLPLFVAIIALSASLAASDRERARAGLGQLLLGAAVAITVFGVATAYRTRELLGTREKTQLLLHLDEALRNRSLDFPARWKKLGLRFDGLDRAARAQRRAYPRY